MTAPKTALSSTDQRAGGNGLADALEALAQWHDRTMIGDADALVDAPGMLRRAAAEIRTDQRAEERERIIAFLEASGYRYIAGCVERGDHLPSPPVGDEPQKDQGDA